MVDSAARTVCIQLLRQLLAEGIVNNDLEDRWPQASDDPAISAIAGQIWHYYDDSPEKRLAPEDIPDAVVRLIERCICFLKSDREYRWPDYSFETRNLTLFRRVFDFHGAKARAEWERFCSAGDVSVWPFLYRDDYESD